MGDARKAAYAIDYYLKNKDKPGIWEELLKRTESFVPAYKPYVPGEG